MAVAVASPFNTTPAYSGTFIPQIWSGKLNAKFYATTVFGEIANVSYEGDIKSLGDKVIINNIPTLAIRDYVAGTPLTYDVPTPNTLELRIDYAKYFGFNVNDVLAYQSQPKLMEMFTDDATNQMKIAIDAAVLNNTFNAGAAANKGATAGVQSGAFNLGTDLVPLDLSGAGAINMITALASVLDEQNVPESDRFLVVSPYVRMKIMQSNLQQAYLTGDGQSILRNGKIGTIDRFTVFVSNQLPKAAAGKDWAGANLTNALKRSAVIAGHKSAITFAAQMTKMEDVPNPTDFGRLVRGMTVYGYQVVKPEALALGIAAG